MQKRFLPKLYWCFIKCFVRACEKSYPNLPDILNTLSKPKHNLNEVQNIIVDAVKYWLPFIDINKIDVKMTDQNSGEFRNTMKIYIEFNLKKDPTTFESIQLTVAD